MNLKKIGAVALALGLSCLLFTACGKTEAKTEKSVGEIFDAVNGANTISNARVLDDMSIELDFMLALDAIAEYKGVASNDANNAGLTLVIKAAEGQNDAVVTALETYTANQSLYWGNYDEFADAKASVDAAITAQKDGYIVLAFASADSEGYDAIAPVIDEALA